MLENFVANAIKYTDNGAVLVACRRRQECFRFEVWDSGRGITEAETAHIYDAFHQLDNPERDRRKGVGLGLAIVDQIAKLLHAPLCVRSTIGKGSVFSIDVPMGEKVQDAMEKTDEKPDLLITDLRLRDHKSGIEVIRLVRSHYKKAIPSIIITGDTGPQQLQETGRAGFPVLYKPVTAEKLQQVIMEVLL